LSKQQVNKKQIQQTKPVPQNNASLLVKFMLMVVAATVPIVFSYWYKGGYELFFPIKIFFTQWPLIVALLAVGFLLFNSSEISIPKNPLNICVFSFFAVSLISLFSTFNLFISLSDIFRLLFYIVFYFLFIIFIRSRKDMTIFLTIVFSAFTIVIFYALLQRAGIDLLAATGGRTGVDSTLGNPDFFAGYLISLIPLLFACVFIVKRQWRVPLVILVVLGTVFLFLTQSRAGFLGLVFSFMLFVFFVLRKKETSKQTKIWIAAFVCFAVVLLLALSFKNGTTLTRIRESMDLKSTNIRFRLLSYRSTLNIIKDHPITGTGTGTFYNVYPKYRVPEMKEVFDFVETPKYTHNDFLQIASETGLLGLGVFLWMIFIFFRQGLRIIKTSKDPYNNWVVLGSVCSFAGMLVQMIFDFNFYRPETALNFWMFLAIISVMSISKDSEGKVKKYAIPANSRSIAGIGLFIACIFLFIFSFSIFMGNVHYNRGMRMDKISDANQDPGQRKILKVRAIDEFKKAIVNEKINDNYYTNLGTFYGNLSRDYQVTEDEKKQYMMGAIKNFEEALKLCPFYAGSHYNLGQSYLFYALSYDKSFMERSENELKKAIALSSFSEAEFFHNQLGLLYKERGMLDQAAQEYEEALKINPKTIQSLINLGNVFYARSLFDKAINCYLKALDIDANNPDARNNLANAYFQKRMFNDAIREYHKVIETNPGYLDAYNNLASVYYVRGMYEEAKQGFMRLLSIAADSSQSNYARSMLSRIP